VCVCVKEVERGRGGWLLPCIMWVCDPLPCDPSRSCCSAPQLHEVRDTRDACFCTRDDPVISSQIFFIFELFIHHSHFSTSLHPTPAPPPPPPPPVTPPPPPPGLSTGSLKGEHGTGRNVAPFVEMEWGTKATELMWELKQLFDPDYVLNPGVILNRCVCVGQCGDLLLCNCSYLFLHNSWWGYC